MIIPIDVKPPKRVEKLWGYELWIHNDEEYCGKLLVFEKEMANLVYPTRKIPIQLDRC